MRRRRFFSGLVGAGGCSLVCGGCGGGEARREVVLYSSVDAGYTRDVVRVFTERSGIVVKLVSDTEAAKSSGLVNRLISERRRPVADVFWSGDVMRAALLKREGLSMRWESAAAAEIDAKFHDPDGHYYGASARLRVLLENRERAAGMGSPGSVTDLAEPGFAERSCLANPVFGTTTMHAAALFDLLGEEGGRGFFEKFAANGGGVVASNGEVRRRVSSGEYAWGLTDSDDVSVAMIDGKPVRMLVPDQGEGAPGALLIPAAVSLIAGCPHPEEARALAEFLVSAEVERLLAKSDAAHLPLRPEVEPPGLFPGGVAALKVMVPDYGELARVVADSAGPFVREWVAGANTTGG